MRNVRGRNSPTGNQGIGYNKYVFHVKENTLIRVFSNVNLEKNNDNADYSVLFHILWFIGIYACTAIPFHELED